MTNVPWQPQGATPRGIEKNTLTPIRYGGAEEKLVKKVAALVILQKTLVRAV